MGLRIWMNGYINLLNILPGVEKQEDLYINYEYIFITNCWRDKYARK